jgi:hypothetical protein
MNSQGAVNLNAEPLRGLNHSRSATAFGVEVINKS